MYGEPALHSSITDDEIGAIARTITRSSVVWCRRIVRIEFRTPKEVKVMTGHIVGPLNGSGESVTLAERDGKWHVVELSHWVS